MASYPAYGNTRASPVNAPYASSSPNATGQSYPPSGPRYDASRISINSEDDTTDPPFKKHGDAVVDMRDITRTPSPTPSEAEELSKTSLVDWKAMAHWRFWIRREWLWYYVICFFGLILVILFTVYHEQIVTWLQPAANWMHKLPFGWLIPIAILFVISFPPLFGHEIIGILCGLVWGLWLGFAIVAVGTFLGELGNFYAFKYCCAARGEKLEQTQITYASLAKVVREGGFKIALIARFSAIPGHFTTAVFSTCGMGVFTFMLAAFLSLPKQFITVYLGVAMEQSRNGSGKNDTIVKDIVLGVTVIITFVAMWYIYSKMNKAKPRVIYDRRKARQAKLMAAAGTKPYSNSAMLQSSVSVGFNPNASESEIPLTAHANSFDAPSYQQWDASGRAVGYSGDPTLYVPVPRRVQPRLPAEAPTHRPQGRTDSGTAYPMSERTPYQPASPVRQTMSPPTYPRPSVEGTESTLPNPFVDPQSTRQPSRPTYTNAPTPPPIPPPPMSPPRTGTQPLAAQRPSGTAPTYTASPPGQYAAFRADSGARAPATAPLPYQTSYAAPPYPPPPAEYPSYESTTSVQSQAGSLPPSYSGASLR